MANRNQVVGQARIKWNGRLFETDGQSTMEIGGPMRESVVGDYQANAFRQATAASKIEMNLLYKAGLSLSELRQIDDATVTVETDTGQTWVMSNAYVSDVISFQTNEGKAKVVMMAGPAEELING